MQTSWALKDLPVSPGQDFSDELVASLKISPLLAGLLIRRGIASLPAARIFLSPSLTDLQDPFLLPGMNEAVKLIRTHLAAGSKILIHGDYDVDGVTASAVLWQALRKLGADPFVFLPHRVSDGYGFTQAGVNAVKKNEAELLITVDCGISAAGPIGAISASGVDVIVVDHHQIPAEGVPQASVIVHPLMGESGKAFKELSAVGLAFKLAQALLGDAAHEFLDLAALGTVADLAPLTGENRILVKYGLRKLFERGTLGLKALMTEAKLKGKVNAGHLGFVLGPRINASGRMASADCAFKLLISEKLKEAEELAKTLDEENRLRQRIERKVCEEAVEKVEREVNFKRDRVMVVWGKHWHQGVLGIVASRLVEKFYRPAIVISFEGEGPGKGSARSIPKFNVFSALEKTAEFLVEFGGHEQAAGLRIEENQLEAFRKAVNEEASVMLDPACLVKAYQVDFEVETLGALSMPFARELDLFEPFGLGNPKPLFLTRNLSIKGQPVYSGKDRLKFWAEDGTATLEASWYRPRFVPGEDLRRIDLIYTLNSKTIVGEEFPYLEVKDLRVSGM